MIILGFGAAGTVLILNDKSPEGLAAIVGALGLLISSLLYGDHRRREELDQKRPEET